MAVTIPECRLGDDPEAMYATLAEAGANVTDDDHRYGIVLTFTQGWLRQEENQHLSMPLADAMALPDDVRTRLGFDMDYGDGGLGFFDPSVLLGGKVSG